MNDAINIIEGQSDGFMVHVHWVQDKFLRSDYFPDKRIGEDLIGSEEDAWILANKFAKKTIGKAVNIYVVNASYIPVEGCQEKHINNRKDCIDMFIEDINDQFMRNGSKYEARHGFVRNVEIRSKKGVILEILREEIEDNMTGKNLFLQHLLGDK